MRYLSIHEWYPPKEKKSRPCVTVGKDGISEMSTFGSSFTNFSRAAPGPSDPHFNLSKRETRSIQWPMAPSSAVASIRKSVVDVTRRNNVCPPETKSVRNGNLGGVSEVRKGVSAWLCWEKMSQPDWKQHDQYWPYDELQPRAYLVQQPVFSQHCIRRPDSRPSLTWKDMSVRTKGSSGSLSIILMQAINYFYILH